MGTSDVIPGVSGGTMALILGIYGELIAALGAMTERATLRALGARRFADAFARIRGGFLLVLLLGIGAAILTLSGVLVYLLEAQREAVYAFFTGLIAASAWLVGRRVRDWSVSSVAALASGAAAAWLVTGSPGLPTGDAPWIFAAVGAVAICALVLPGISGAFILLLLGKYDRVLGAIRGLELSVLVPFGLGAVVGLLAFTRTLKWLLTHRPNTTLALLVGFLIGSLREVWPWRSGERGIEGGVAEGAAVPGWTLPPDAGAALVGAALALAGVAVVLLLERWGAARPVETERGS